VTHSYEVTKRPVGPFPRIFGWLIPPKKDMCLHTASPSRRCATSSSKVCLVAGKNYSPAMGMWSDHYLELAAARTPGVCRLHVLLCDLVPGGTFCAPDASSTPGLGGDRPRQARPLTPAWRWRGSCTADTYQGVSRKHRCSRQSCDRVTPSPRGGSSFSSSWNSAAAGKRGRPIL
jgi:hypothetical protein